MKTATAEIAAPVALRTIHVPKIGALWSGQGGTFVGIGRRQGETRDHLVILAPVEKKDGSFADGIAYAKGLTIDGHADFEPAQPEDGHLCQANVPHLFEKRAYWLGKQDAAVERWAWYQGFSYGTQYYNRRGYQLRLFAVRRIPI
jgi:hypothetical protein